ncbi:hypothetical protein EDD66_101392 [Mobilisporobacter senegalensis]|uniref:Uncharacterized protein n=1 Tax=Mobilisporobacter senegalensis TaxID=1329262 RepID=A0A3N1XYW9_9FIRM|nr:hypothetical protein [Mobilisporobacter senegalensis]ROR31774.1 hypothetical protein EDD66_101392 [Mobilisporobacter senegalensis]
MNSLEAFAKANKYTKIASELETYISVIKNEIEWHLEDSSLGNPSISGGNLEGKYVDLFEMVLDKWKINFRSLLEYSQTALDTASDCKKNALEKAEYYNREGRRLHAIEEAERRRAEEARRRAEEAAREIKVR